MDPWTRREFLQTTSIAGVGASLGVAALAGGPRENGAPANQRVRLAVVGLHGRGGNLARKFAARPDCEVAYVCDVDGSLLAPIAQEIEQIQGRAPKRAGDFRRVLDDPFVDAIVVATPDHWHATPLTF